MADEMQPATGLGQSLLDGLVQLTRDEQVGTLRIEADPGKERLVSDARQPLMQRRQISIWTQESRDEHHCGTVAVRYSETVV